jgi:NAD(P)-dependent dehydrogenase (short-subunit alcohol dehydrogenase family)
VIPDSDYAWPAHRCASALPASYLLAPLCAGAFLMSLAVLPLMPAGDAAIIHISSTRALQVGSRAGAELARGVQEPSGCHLQCLRCTSPPAARCCLASHFLRPATCPASPAPATLISLGAVGATQ